MAQHSKSRSRSIESAKDRITHANISLPVDHVDSIYSDCVSSKHTTDLADDLSDHNTSKGHESPSQIDRQSSTLLHDNYHKNKWRKLFRRSSFWMRILTLLLSIILLTLSTAYCIAQKLKVELDLVTECTPMTLPEIWEYSASIAQPGELTKESQYGRHNASCKTTKKMEFNTHQLWYMNYYKSNWTDTVNAQCVWFALLSLYCLIVSTYTVIALILDIIHVKHNRLHTKSTPFVDYTNNKSQTQQNIPPKKEKRASVVFKACMDTYKLYCGVDTSLWIVWMFSNEIIEIVIQSNALLLYNGYNILDTTHSKAVYTAAKPEYIILFAIFIALNCWGSGVVWLSYGVAPNICYGLLFKLSLFFVDQFSDLFYAIFPFIVILDDQYNSGSDVWVLFGQLNIDSPLKFIAAFFPLFLLCNKCLQIAMHSRKTLSLQYYNEWKVVRDLSRQKDNTLAAYQARLQGVQVNSDTLDNTQELYDENGKLKISISSDPDSSSSKDSSTKKNVLISVTALCYIVYGIVLLVLVTQYLKQSEAHCNLVKESNYFHMINGSIVMDNVTLSDEEIRLLQVNPELFMYDACLYKMYPFTKDERTKCQCKVLVIEDWTDLKSSKMQRETFNVTQQRILIGMLQNWFMLEKFRTKGGKQVGVEVTMDTSLYKARNMKAFEWSYYNIIVNQEGISNWDQLEYLKFEEVTDLQFSSNDIGELKQLKQLSLISTGLREFPEAICDMTHLDVLQIRLNFIASVPHCIRNLTHLEQLVIDSSQTLVNIPLSMFSLPNLYDLSLYSSSITYVDLISYNLDGTDIDINDTEEINEWFDTSFKWNPHTTYWLQRTPLCDENLSDMPTGFADFMRNNATKCHYECTDYLGEPPVEHSMVYACAPYLIGDGKCDLKCNNPYCGYDKGDCVQQCFAKNTDYTNCTWDKYTNDRCDEGCDNKYCAGYMMRSNWSSLISYTGNNSDLEHCKNGEWARIITNTGNITRTGDKSQSVDCRLSQSVYIEWDNEKQFKECLRGDWIMDGLCDDACRTEECNYDGSDCDGGCQEEGDLCLTVYSIWTGFLGTTQYKFGHDYMCSTVWPMAVAYFDLPQNMSCEVEARNTDYNEDGMINFREFVVLGMQLVTAENWNGKATQVNCSSCIGVENYNV
eukprot:306793_1